MIKSIIVMCILLASVFAQASDSLPFMLDTRDAPVLSKAKFAYDSLWIGENSAATVVISDNGSEVFRGCGAGNYEWISAADGRHTLTYTTYINGVAQSEVYEATLYAGYKYEVVDGKAILQGMEYQNGVLNIPSEIDGYPVVEIAAEAFAWCTDLTEVIIPDSVADIGSTAFEGCNRISKVKLPASASLRVSYFPGLKQAKFNSYNDFTSSILDSPTCANVSGVLMGYAYDTSSASRTFTDPVYGGSHKWNTQYTTFGYVGHMYMKEGCKYVFGKYFDDCVLVKINGTQVLKSTEHTEFVTGAYTPAMTGWHEIEVRVVDNTGDKGPKGVQNSSYWSGELGVGWRDDGITAANPESGWKKLMDPGDGSLFRVFESESGINVGPQMKILFPDSYEILTNVTLTGSVAELPNNMFDGCVLLTSVNIPEGVEVIGGNTFANCAGLTSITIPDSVTSIGAGAFSGCASLIELAIPDSITEIGVSAFRNCSSLVRVTIPNSITSISDNAFLGCANLTDVTIPDSVTSIGAGAFSGCASLIELAIPDSITEIGVSAFRNCSSLVRVTIPTGITNISDNTFLDCANLTDVTIPDGVTSIGASTFYGCSGLTSVTIPTSVTSIGSSAFYGCSGLTSVTIPASVTSIGYYAFDGCKPENVTLPGRSCGIDLSSVTNLVISEGTTSIESCAFYDCSSLTSITVPDSVTSIDDGAFYGCSGLTSITIPDGVTSIGYSAFRGCSGLTSITIPNSVTSIGAQAFNGCSGLMSIIIPDSVTSIGDFAFDGCSGLTSIMMPSRFKTQFGDKLNGCPITYIYTIKFIVDGSVFEQLSVTNGLSIAVFPEIGGGAVRIFTRMVY